MTAVSDQLTVSFVNGETRKIFMSFGLLSRLAAYVGDVSQLSEVHQNFDLQQVLFREVLSVRDEQGTITEEYSIINPNMEMSIESGDVLLEWIGGHLDSFFLKRLHAALKSQKGLMTVTKA